ncbi:D-alanine--D-alanine ligase family protein [Desulfovibrio litoralis]|uniref:D-alanine--D-alanine ligase n=1 Tax=Desulfovibrio litoralis DSM 11393 TaxID=1121455 RepID=A0A1M7T5N5_9BACT|nr:D-alanine--D-alanine ligase [Desulfovibrio litoralis]SHN66007.1 D-alanine--D-alanine ligase [Desulfovibrio litoralis DSM 11393]
MNILLIAGGWSSERDVSLSGAVGIKSALQRLGHQVTFFDPKISLNGLTKAVKNQDFAFINLHGCPGEDGLIQAMLEALKCPYQGSNPAGSFLALNKAAAKELFRHANLPTADWELLSTKPQKNWRPTFEYPVFIKSNTGGSSLELAKINNETELANSLDTLLNSPKEFIVEPNIEGVEITCGILDETPLPPILIRPKIANSDFFDYKSKYTKGGAEEICPAPISKELTEEIQALTLKAHKLLGLSDYSRADFILDKNEKLWLLEVNTLPGMTPTSLIPQEAAAIGLDYDALVSKLIDLGLRKKQYLK